VSAIPSYRGDSEAESEVVALSEPTRPILGSDDHRALGVVLRIGDLRELDSERQKGTV
jgi:hypothetical protein